MDKLVQRLTEEGHPVTASRYKTAEQLKQAIDRGYVLLKFTDTLGGTELGVRLDNTATHVSEAECATATGSAHLEGNLTLNYRGVRCVADVALATLEGKGHLEMLKG